MRFQSVLTSLFGGVALLLPVATAHAQSPGDVLTLRRAVGLAVQNSRDLALARAQRNVADRAVALNRSVFLPNLYTGSGAAYSSGFPLDAPSVFNLSFVQTVFNPPLRGELRASQERAEIRKLEVDRVRDAVIARTASAYLELAQVRHGLELLRRELASAGRILDVTSQRAAAGLELPVEVTRSQLTVARIRQRIVQHEGREESLETELRHLTGLPAGQRLEVSADEFPCASGSPCVAGSSDELVNMAVANSPELKAAERERRAREHRWKGERGGYLPTVDLVARYAVFSRFNNYDEFYNRFERNNLNVGVQVRIPIFASRTNSAVQLARSELDAAELELQSKRVELERNVRRQTRLDQELEAGREVARLELALAQEDLRLEQARFDQGRVNLRELEKARLDEHEKWMAFLDADLARKKAQLELLRSTGQLARVFQ